MPALDADNTNPTPTFDVSVTKCTHPTFGILRVVMRDGEPWFVAGDVCKTLEIENPRDATQRLDADEKNTVVLSDGIRGNPNKTIISEAGLYSLVLSSRKPEAKAFKRWVTHDILPSIRKHGAYMPPVPTPDWVPQRPQGVAVRAMIFQYVPECGLVMSVLIGLVSTVNRQMKNTVFGATRI